MSPRAAWRLETLGFTQVYDYVPGKAAWLASGLPTEGRNASPARAGDVVRRDVPTCLLTDHLGDIQALVQKDNQDICIVVNDKGVVLGRLRSKALNAAPDTPVEEVMEPGPTTTRPDDALDVITERLQRAKVKRMIVTGLDGRLIGVLHREDAEQRLAGVH